MTSPAPESPAKEQPGEQNAAPQVTSTLQRESGSMLPAAAAPDVAGMVKRALRNEAAFHHLMSACQEALNHPHGLRMQDRELANALRYAISISHGESKTEEPRISALIEKLGQGWILVEERLPKSRYGDGTGEQELTSDDVAVLLANGEKCVANCTHGNWYDPIANRHLFSDSVTHWMPLPPPPERP